MGKSINMSDLMGDVVKGNTEEPVKKDESLTKHSITLKGKEYTIKLLDWETGIDLWEHILKVILPSVGVGFDSAGKNSDEDDVMNTFTEALTYLAMNLNGKTLQNYSKVLFQGATVDGVEFDISEEFKGNYGSWKSLLIFALKENYGSFFEEGLGENLSGLMTMFQGQTQA